MNDFQLAEQSLSDMRDLVHSVTESRECSSIINAGIRAGGFEAAPDSELAPAQRMYYNYRAIGKMYMELRRRGFTVVAQ